jgi:lactaldehyde dehydrogenase/glycolaldehyde dehydrogenase
VTMFETSTVNLVGSEWVSGDAGAIPVIDPSTEETIAEVPTASASVVGAALDSATGAQQAWAWLPAVERGLVVRAIADVMESHRPRLAELLMRETGKPLRKAYGEIDWAAGYLRYMAEWERRVEGEILPSDNRNESIHLVREPVGVVAAICAWNYPIALFARKVGPALVAGNSLVVKPSEVAPLATIELVRRIHEKLDIPDGVLNLVTGDGRVGAQLVADRRTNMVTFTGHRDTGKQIAGAAAQNLTRVSLELGGKAPAIVLADADLDLAVAAVVAARHENSGQVCTCAERVLVHASIAEAFTEQYVAAASQLRLGLPAEDLDMGPLVSSAQLSKNLAAVATARSEGATVFHGGGRPADKKFARGYWLEPTVITGVTSDMQIMREETFGPITPIVAFETVDEAMSVANSTRYGLAAYIFTRDYATAMRAVRDVAAGEIYVNRTLGEAYQGFHTGHRESGLGGEDGKLGILMYTEVKSIYHRYGP